MRRIGVCSDPRFARHDNGLGHPESPSRLDAVGRGIDHAGDSAGPFVRIEPRPAELDELLLVHAPRYLDSLAATAERELTRLDFETSANRWSYDTAILAAGASIAAVDAVLAGDLDGAFCAVRPPGHHAEYDEAMGFCLINNAALAARWAVVHGGCGRVAVVDWDVHHGNGTMHRFYTDQSVLYVSIHQYPHYPGTGTLEEIGEGSGAGYTVNVPFSPGAGDEDYEAVFARVIDPILQSFHPDLVIVSAGYDAHRLDTIAAIELSSGMYREMTAHLREATEDSCGMVVLLEGGYHDTALAEGTAETLAGMVCEIGRGTGTASPENTERGRSDRGERAGRLEGGLSHSTTFLIEGLHRRLTPYWPALDLI